MTLPGLAHAGKTAKTADIYSATESANVAGIAPTGNQEPVAIAAPRKVTYDAVPIDQVDSILKRLKLVEEILQKYGRAYDYRTHTTHEFETILTQLAAASRPAATETKSLRVLPSLPAVPVTVPASDSAS
ncbi:MAG: hypothetical protein P4M08_04785 [Oligoflexia bacterium]|nr:hypothetical protein [Oligoflexia bacterium]